MITTKDIDKLATLSRLKLSEEEKEQFQNELGSILTYVDQIKKVSGNLKNDSVASENHNVLREDVATNKKGEYKDSLLELAPKKEGGFVKVKKIL